MLDVDSTLSGVEGIDSLAALRSEAVRARVAEITDRAMRGDIPLADVYADRLMAVRPTRSEVSELGREYVVRMESGASETLAKLANSGVKIVLVSAGIHDAIIPLARSVGVADSDVHAVPVYFTDDGDYERFDTASPLTHNGGKAVVVRKLHLPRPILAVGDGMTDAELTTLDPRTVDAFAAYTGVVERAQVVSVADYAVNDFKQLLALILGNAD